MNGQKTAALPACPVETTLMLIGDKWEVLILRDLLAGTKRFGELKKSMAAYLRRCWRRSCARWRKTVL